jgi:hypothetical protein
VLETPRALAPRRDAACVVLEVVDGVADPNRRMPAARGAFVGADVEIVEVRGGIGERRGSSECDRDARGERANQRDAA